MYDNDNGTGYIRKGPGTKPPRHYETSRYCILKTTMLLRDGYDLFLTSNGVVLCYDDIPCRYFEIVGEFPYLGYHFAIRTTGHGLPPEIKIGTWRHNMTVREKYEEYLPSGEISQYLENDQIVEWRVPHSPFQKKRTTAWEFMGQEVPERYLKLLNNFPNDRRKPEACDDMPYGLPSSLTSEVGNTPVDIYIATEEATGSASAEVVGSGSTGSASAEVVEELSTRSKLELQAVQIITENPWHLFQSGIMTLRNNKGERITNVFGEAVLIVREYHLLSTSQQEDLRSQGITRHIWERYPLSGHAILLCTRAWEIGRMTGYVKKYHSTAEAEAYQQKLQYNEFVGWRRDVPEPFAARPEDRNPASLARERIEEEKRQRRHEEGVRFTELEPKEEVRYGEELEERKQQDIFSHTSTREFMEALRPEMDENLSSAQSSLERILFQEPARQTYQRLHSNKMSLLEPLEPEERVKIEVPKPQRTEDPMAEEEPYDCALDKLGQLDKYNKNKNFGFYGKYFRETHARSLNFYKYRTTNPAGHPHCPFEFDEEKFMDTYVQLFFSTPTIEDYFHGKTVVYGGEDHRLRVANTEPQEQRSRIAKQLFEERQLKLKDMVAGADKDEFSYDDIISDITELFLSGEKIERNPESLGSSSKSLTTLMWNLGNWRRGMNWRLPSVVDEDKIYYKEHRKEKFPDHVEENNNLFLQMLKNLRAHIMLVCEAGTLEPHQKYLQDHGWSLCFNDAKDLCVLARLGKDGSIVQIGGPKDDNVWSGPNRKISFGIFEICWGLAIDRETYASSSTGYFDRNTVQDFVDMERARMKVTRVCVYHVDHDSAGKSHGVTGEVFAHMLYECICHQVTIVGGDANRLCYYKSGKQLNSSYSMSTCQFWTERMEQTMDRYFKDVLQNNKDFNVRQFHSMSYLDLKYLQDTIGGRQDLLREVREETDQIGDCCLLTFFEYGLSTPAEVFHDGNNSDLLEYKYSVNELLFYLTNDVLLLREKDKDAHCPLLVTIEPSDMTNKEKRTFNTVEQKKQRAANRKEIQKQNKAKGKARAST